MAGGKTVVVVNGEGALRRDQAKRWSKARRPVRAVNILSCAALSPDAR